MKKNALLIRCIRHGALGYAFAGRCRL